MTEAILPRVGEVWEDTRTHHADSAIIKLVSANCVLYTGKHHFGTAKMDLDRFIHTYTPPARRLREGDKVVNAPGVPSTRLSGPIAREIFQLHGQGIMPRELAETYGVTDQSIYNILNGQAWGADTFDLRHKTDARPADARLVFKSPDELIARGREVLKEKAPELAVAPVVRVPTPQLEVVAIADDPWTRIDVLQKRAMSLPPRWRAVALEDVKRLENSLLSLIEEINSAIEETA